MFIDDLPPDYDNRPALATLARTLLDEISRAFYVNQQEVYLTASVGVAICPYDAENVIDLIRNADAAMYPLQTERREFQRLLRAGDGMPPPVEAPRCMKS